MNVLEIIKNNNLDNNDKFIVETLYSQVQKGNDKITIRQLSSLTYASTSSIMRLAKKIGFYGYSDMVYSFRKQLREVVEFDSGDTLSAVAISSQSLDVVDELVKDITSKEFARIHLHGLGYSTMVCEYMRDKLVEQNYFACCTNPLDLENNDKSLVILVSNSGETSDLFSIVKGSRKRGHKVYVISSQENSTLCKMNDRNIIIASKKFEMNRSSYFIGNAIILMEKITNAIYHYE